MQNKLQESMISSLEHLRPYDSTQDPIFPPELVKFSRGNICFTGSRVNWYAPETVNKLFDIISKYPGAKVIGAGALTGVQIEINGSKLVTQQIYV